MKREDKGQISGGEGQTMGEEKGMLEGAKLSRPTSKLGGKK